MVPKCGFILTSWHHSEPLRSKIEVSSVLYCLFCEWLAVIAVNNRLPSQEKFHFCINPNLEPQNIVNEANSYQSKAEIQRLEFSVGFGPPLATRFKSIKRVIYFCDLPSTAFIQLLTEI